MPKYFIYYCGTKHNHIRFKTTNLNPFGKFDQHDDLYQVLKVLRPDLTDIEILNVITEERIRRHVMDIDTTMIRRVLKNYVPEYTSTKVDKVQLKQLLDTFETGTIIIRMGTSLIVYDADTGDIFTGIRELYGQRPVAEYWTKETHEE